MRLALCLLMTLILPLRLMAQEGPQAGKDGPDMQDLLTDYRIAPQAGDMMPDDSPGWAIYQRLPQSVRDAIGRFGIDHLDFAEDLITGYGDIDRIDRDTLRAYVGFQRAGLRGGAADSLISADLDGDGAVTRQEKAQAMRLLSSGLRARLARTHDAADLNDDGTVSASEMKSYPDSYAMQRFGSSDEDRVIGLMAFDLNDDGWVEVDELRQGLRVLQDSGAADGGGFKLLIGG